MVIVIFLLAASVAFGVKDSCLECHSIMEGMSIVFKDDVHYKFGISCADCHGGDPKEDDANVSLSAASKFRLPL